MEITKKIIIVMIILVSMPGLMGMILFAQLSRLFRVNGFSFEEIVVWTCMFNLMFYGWLIYYMG